jgi:Polysaccharide lyase
MHWSSQTRCNTMCYVLLCVFFAATVYRPHLANAQPILWSAGHDTGNMDEWWAPEKAGVEGNNCGGEYNSNGGRSRVSTIVAHRGRFSARLYQRNTARTPDVGVRLFRWCESRRQAIGTGLYYSAWYYIPTQVTVHGWWSIMEWKSRGSTNAKVFVGVENRADGSMFAHVCQGEDSGGRCWNQKRRNLPVAQWFHLEVYYVKSTNSTGRVVLWQDGTRIIDATDVDTANSKNLEWAVISYGTDLDPSDNTTYIDDAAISRKRIGRHRGSQ